MSCVLTLAFDEASQQRFDLERRRYFPPALNRIPAHLTLFHTLPECEGTIETLRCTAATAASFALHVSEVRSIGRGVAFKAEAKELTALHRSLRTALEQVLSPQDLQGFRPHVVVQNKVSQEVARDTLTLLRAEFVPWQSQAVGLDLWRYLDGPWLHLRHFEFSGS